MPRIVPPASAVIFVVLNKTELFLHCGIMNYIMTSVLQKNVFGAVGYTSLSSSSVLAVRNLLLAAVDIASFIQGRPATELLYTEGDIDGHKFLSCACSVPELMILAELLGRPHECRIGVSLSSVM